jgi:hypothetical protein
MTKRSDSKIAASAIRKFRKAGPIASAAPTPERLLRAGGAARIETFRSPVHVSQDGCTETTLVPTLRIRIEESPLMRLRARGLLTKIPKVSGRNELLAAAGERYLGHWRGAGLSPLRAIDFTKDRVSGGSTGLLRTERQLAHFQAYESAERALGNHLGKVVDAVVLKECEPLEVGREISGYRQPQQATAVALHLLRAGLETLALHFGLMTHRD